MATFAIGDIHGNLAALQDLLGQIHGEVSKDDVVVFLGDYIDRGDDSRGCIDAILSFRDEGEARVFCLKGNHEDWLLRTRADYRRHSWLIAMEAFPTIRSYSAEAEHTLREALSQAGADAYMDHCPLPYEVFFDAVPQTHHAFLSELTLSFDGPDCFCSHAGLNPQVALSDQSPRSLIWGSDGFPAGYSGPLTIVYGHHNDPERDSAGWPHPRIVGNAIGIDTIAHGVLTAIRMPDRHVFQSGRHVNTGSVPTG